MSVIAFLHPGMWSGVSGEHRANCRRSANARISCMATFECLAAKRWIQWTVGELSLKSATWASVSVGHTSSMTSHNNSRPASSRSEFVNVPVGLALEMMLAEMSGGHRNLNTVGGTDLFSPMITPPTPWLDASFTPI